MSEICVLGVTYPGLEPFIDDYLVSLANQTVSDFIILIANDGFEEIQHYLKQHSLESRASVIEMNGSPTLIRRELLIHAQEMHPNYFIFTDCDDVLNTNRVEESISLLESYDVVVNDLCVCDENLKITFPNYLSKRIDDGQILSLIDLLDSNFMGLTNTACRKKVLQVCSSITNSSIVAFDWLFWSMALLSDYSAVFTNKTSTKYRVYNCNTAGLPQKLDQNSIDFGLSVKQLHYETLSSIFCSNEAFRNRLFQIEHMIKYNNKKSIYEKMIQSMNEHYPFWWENIRHIDLSAN